MPEQESILQLKSEVQTLKIKDEYRSKELDGLMAKLSDTSTKLNALSENIGRLLAAQDVNKMTDKEFREEMKILHTRIGDLQDKMNMMVDKTETRMNTDINSIYTKLESLERWRWITIGAATFVAWLLTHVVPKYVN
jgi:predicted nuclease with TOPRIM domain|tara:strand:+ start:247 stop:657 length:411 start_codon:yes stop_codon:yes gene_type:complete